MPRKPTKRQKKTFDKMLENGGNASKAARESGYSSAMAKNPQKITESDGFLALLDEYLPEEDLSKKHKELLNSMRIDHMIFPLGPDEREEEEIEEDEENGKLLTAEHTNLSDKDIKDLLKSVNCTVRKIVHGQQARHVYFWSPDNKARKEALEMAYKLRGRFKKDEIPLTPTFQQFNFYNLPTDEVRGRMEQIIADGASRVSPAPKGGDIPDSKD